MVATVVGIVVDTKRDTTAPPREAAPATATQHSVRATTWASRISLRTTTVSTIPVLTPLVNIASHIVDTKFVWGFLTYWVGLAI